MRLSVIFPLIFLVASCGQVEIQDYTNTQPTLNLRTFFDGELRAYGVLQNRSGKVTRKFTADIEANWDGNTGYLNEVFVFDDGERAIRNWTLNVEPSGNVFGTANDVIGIAKGRISGSAMRWVYTLSVPYNDGTIHVKIDDWLYLVNNEKIINKSVLKKFGFTVGHLTLVIEKTTNVKR